MIKRKFRQAVSAMAVLGAAAALAVAGACGPSAEDGGAQATSAPAVVATVAPTMAPTAAPTATPVPPTATPTPAPTATSAPTATPTALCDMLTKSEVTIAHYSGTDTVPFNPETVVVADIAALLSLNDLGVGADALVGLGIPVPDEYDAVNNPGFPSVGTAWEPDYEAINALEPDLIIVASRTSRLYPEMRRIAPTVDLTVDWGKDYMDYFREQHRAMGEIFGVSEKVEARLAELDAKIAGISARTADAGKALIVMTSGAEVTAYGPGSRFGFVHDLFGYAAADLDLEREATHGDAVSFEYILEMEPEALFVIDRDAAIGQEGEAAQQVLDNELVVQTPAWRNGRGVYVDSFAWYIAASSLPSFFQVADDVESSLP